MSYYGAFAEAATVGVTPLLLFDCIYTASSLYFLCMLRVDGVLALATGLTGSTPD